MGCSSFVKVFFLSGCVYHTREQPVSYNLVYRSQLRLSFLITNEFVKPNGNFGSDEQKTMSYQIGKHKGHQINKLDTDKSASED